MPFSSYKFFRIARIVNEQFESGIAVLISLCRSKGYKAAKGSIVTLCYIFLKLAVLLNRGFKKGNLLLVSKLDIWDVSLYIDILLILAQRKIVMQIAKSADCRIHRLQNLHTTAKSTEYIVHSKWDQIKYFLTSIADF